MPFIGNKPSAVPLTAADITDSIITSAKIVDGTIVNGDINASAGLVLTKLASTGTITLDNIQFPATAVASANANNLDDYEEGTFTPTIIGSSTTGTFTPNGSYTYGRYTKIGRLVHVYFGLVWSSFTGTGNIKLGGLPFTSFDEFAEPPFLLHGAGVVKPANTIIYGVIDRNVTVCRVFTVSTSAVANNVTELPVDSAGEFYFSLTYQV
jgi:hypothetical protein